MSTTSPAGVTARVSKKARKLAIRAELRMASLGIVRPGLRMPDFVGIGSPQSATTWISANLDAHPDVAISRRKETRFFSRHIAQGLGWYADHFIRDRTKLVGEFTPDYGLMAAERIALLRKIRPGVRLILTMRNPIDRAWADARRTMEKMARHWGCEFVDVPQAEFIDFFELEFRYNSDVLNRGVFAEPGVKYGHYGTIIDNWLRFFPSDQLLTIFYDEIKADPAGVLWRVLEHIGARTDVDPSLFSTERVNANPKHPMPDWAREHLEQMYRPEIERMKQRFGDQMPDW